MMMKASVAVVTFFLLFSSVLTSAPATQPEKCCFSFYQKKIPAHVVQSFRHTDIHCGNRAVVITMTNNKDICVDPSSEWVKKLMNDYEQHRPPAPQPPAPQPPAPQPPAPQPRQTATQPQSPPTSASVPATSTPVPATSDPAPTASTPVPATSVPAPTASTPVPATSILAPAANASSPGLQSPWTRQPTPSFPVASVRSMPTASPVPTTNTFSHPHQRTQKQMNGKGSNDLLTSCQFWDED